MQNVSTTPINGEVTPEPCPLCSGPMQWKQNRTSKTFFMGCLRWPGCHGTRTVDGKNSVIGEQVQNRLHRLLKAAVLASDDECLIFNAEQLDSADRYELHLDEIKEDKSYIVTVRERT